MPLVPDFRKSSLVKEAQFHVFRIEGRNDFIFQSGSLLCIKISEEFISRKGWLFDERVLLWIEKMHCLSLAHLLPILLSLEGANWLVWGADTFLQYFPFPTIQAELVPFFQVSRTEHTLVLLHYSFNRTELGQHLLVVTATLVSVSRFYCSAHLRVDAHHPAITGRKLKGREVLKEEIDVAFLFNSAPVILALASLSGLSFGLSFRSNIPFLGFNEV